MEIDSILNTILYADCCKTPWEILEEKQPPWNLDEEQALRVSIAATVKKRHNHDKLAIVINHPGFWEFEKVSKGVLGQPSKTVWKIGIEFKNTTVTWFEGATKTEVINSAYEAIQKSRV